MASSVVLEYDFAGDYTDSSGNGLDATNNGTTFTTDQNGTSNEAVSFNGTSQDITRANNSAFQVLDGDFVYIFLLKRSTTPSGTEELCRKRGGGGGNGIEAKMTSSGYLNFVLDAGSNTNITGSTNRADDVWHMIFFQRVGSTISIYVDKETTPDATGTRSGNANDSSTLYIGSDRSIGTWFGGDMSLFQVRDGTTDQTERDSIYDSFFSAPGVLKNNLFKGGGL